ncbi:GSCOCG00008075001-RA-CDS, partial [Cotesia congregata]
TISDLSSSNLDGTKYSDPDRLTTTLTRHYAAMMDSDGTLGRVPSNGGRGLRRQRSLEWRERRGYGASVHSSSDDDDNNRHAVPTSVSSRGARSPGHVFASLMAQQYSGTNDRTYHRAVSDNEGGVTSENQTTGFPASVAVAGSVPGALTPNHRQASPFPMESTNSRRHHYNNSVSSDRSRNKTSSGSGSVAGGGNASTGSVSGGTLGRRSRRGQHNSALSSSSTASDRSEIIYNEEHSHIHLNN